MRLKPLLAAAAAAVVALAAAPAARANWMTTTGKPPAFGADSVCALGMEFHYATFAPGRKAFQPVLRNVQVTDWNPLYGSPGLAGPLYRGGLAVPDSPLHIDPADIGAPPSSWPDGEGWFEYSADFVLPFAREVLPGQRVWIRWDDPSGQRPWMEFPVQDCLDPEPIEL